MSSPVASQIMIQESGLTTPNCVGASSGGPGVIMSLNIAKSAGVELTGGVGLITSQP